MKSGAAGKLVGIAVYQVDLPLREGGYSHSGGRHYSSLDSTIVALQTESGLVGWGEICPFGSNYVAAFAKGARAAIAELAASLLGMPAENVTAINMAMDRALYGHPYAKSAIDMACWDIVGKSWAQPLYKLFGGKVANELPLTASLSYLDSHASIEEQLADAMVRRRAEGHRIFKIKATGNVRQDIDNIRLLSSKASKTETLIMDGNGGWLQGEAIEVGNAVRGENILFDQPCASYDESLAFRRTTGHRLMLDEAVTDAQVLFRAISDRAADVVSLKISRVGGLSKARILRDICMEAGLAVEIRDTAGSEIAGAATAHLGHSTNPRYLSNVWNCASVVTIRTCEGGPMEANGSLQASAIVGLGVAPINSILGEPVHVYGSYQAELT